MSGLFVVKTNHLEVNLPWSVDGLASLSAMLTRF